VGKVIGEVSTLYKKQKILKENGISVTGDGTKQERKELMQEKLANSRKMVAGKKKGNKVQPIAGDGAAEAGDEDANKEEDEEPN
jgi:hypothetical protein